MGHGDVKLGLNRTDSLQVGNSRERIRVRIYGLQYMILYRDHVIEINIGERSHNNRDKVDINKLCYFIELV
jgi:hypothetical protein